MARNEEKHVTRLNRLLLQQQREDEEKRNPKRPKLNTLNSAPEIQKWLPSLKKDMDFYLKQSQVPCYPAQKISEFSQEIDRLKREYKAFVRKLRECDPSVKIVPWTERGYTNRKRPAQSPADSDPALPKLQVSESDNSGQRGKSDRSETVVKYVPIATPILEDDKKYVKLYGYQTESVIAPVSVCHELEDKPLIFNRQSNHHDTGCSSETPADIHTHHNDEDHPVHVAPFQTDYDHTQAVATHRDKLEGSKSTQANSLMSLAEIYGEDSSDTGDSDENGIT